ncbi:MAG: fibronectin type III-like domain-contianing protein, partial [Candidatus Promineifilaceae bacterium]
RESLYVGYRYYDSVGQEVLFPFGHGLSYTTFEYGDLRLSTDRMKDTDSVAVTLSVTNSGPVAGKEIVQLYVRDVRSTVFRPDKELKGFEKVALQPGETADVTIELGRRAFAFYDPGAGDWVVEAGKFEILIGASAADIRLQGTVEVESAQRVSALREPAVYHHFAKGEAVGKADFERLLGRPVPPNEAAKKGTYTMNTPIGDLKDSIVGRRLYSYLEGQMAKMVEGQEDTPTGVLMMAVAREMPLRGILMMGDGSISREILDGLIDLTNGKYVHGAEELLRGMVGGRR